MSSIIFVIELTFSAILMTLTGQVPVSIWFPLIEDVFANAVNMIVNFIF
jgi:hypothetical protein